MNKNKNLPPVKNPSGKLYKLADKKTGTYLIIRKIGTDELYLEINGKSLQYKDYEILNAINLAVYGE